MEPQTKTYLDYAATTPVDRRVLEAMLPYFSGIFGNPSSVHTYGQQAEAALETARESVAQAFNCQPSEVVFTSCGSERYRRCGGAAFAMQSSEREPYPDQPGRAPCRFPHRQQLAGTFGFELEYLPVDEYGQVRPDVAQRLRPDTAVVSVMYANNEIGTVSPIAEIGALCRVNDIPFTAMLSRPRAICLST
jgi:cysteine desulfurase